MNSSNNIKFDLQNDSGEVIKEFDSLHKAKEVAEKIAAKCYIAGTTLKWSEVVNGDGSLTWELYFDEHIANCSGRAMVIISYDK